MELIDIVFNYLTSLIQTHKPQSITVSAALLIVLILINPKVAKAAGRAFSDLLKKIPIFGKPLEDKIEQTTESFADGMKEDDIEKRQAEIKEKLIKENPILQIEISPDGEVK
jgi:hypothetical protein